jgi:arginine exporter protein ArgO
MSEVLISGLLAGYGVAIPVGAIGVLILSLSARTSLAVGAAAGLGTAAADGIYALVAVVGGAALAALIRPAATPLRWAAAIVLVVLAAHTALSALRRHRYPTRAAGRAPGLSTPLGAFTGLLGLTLLNPATVVYFTALVLGRQAGQARSLAASAVFVLAVLAASASWQLLLAVGGSAVGRALAGPRGRLATALVSSGLIGLLAVRLIFAG